jgi:hypothetical protein
MGGGHRIVEVRRRDINFKTTALYRPATFELVKSDVDAGIEQYLQGTLDSVSTNQRTDVAHTDAGVTKQVPIGIIRAGKCPSLD